MYLLATNTQNFIIILVEIFLVVSKIDNPSLLSVTRQLFTYTGLISAVTFSIILNGMPEDTAFEVPWWSDPWFFVNELILCASVYAYLLEFCLFIKQRSGWIPALVLTLVNGLLIAGFFLMMFFLCAPGTC